MLGKALQSFVDQLNYTKHPAIIREGLERSESRDAYHPGED